VEAVVAGIANFHTIILIKFLEASRALRVLVNVLALWSSGSVWSSAQGWEHVRGGRNWVSTQDRAVARYKTAVRTVCRHWWRRPIRLHLYTMPIAERR